MREIRPSGSEGGGAALNRLSLPLSDLRGRSTPLAAELLHLPGEPAGGGLQPTLLP